MDQDYADWDLDEEMIGFGDDEISFGDCLSCVKHSIIYAFFNTVAIMLLVNFGLKLVLQVVIRIDGDPVRRELIGRYCILLAGLILIFYHFFDNLVLGFIVLAYSVLGVSALSFRTNLTNHFLWVYIFIAISLNELLNFIGFVDHMRIRIHLMCASMKLIALKSFLRVAILEKEKKFPHFGFLITYLIHPQSLPLGGYFPPNLDHSIDHYSSFRLLKRSLFSLLQSFMFLGISDCFMLLIMNTGENIIVDSLTTLLPELICQLIGKLFITYSTALQFRTSHYFICFLIQFNHNFWVYEATVAKPLMVELPRSLVDVVIAWDIPMHQWLKEYIYKPCKDKFGFAGSIFFTYAISSYIHGFRFEIWSVLLSLGLLTWIESLIRNLLANTMNSCIGAKSCSYKKADCDCRINPKYLVLLQNKLQSLLGSPVDPPKCTRNHSLTPFNSISVLIINFAFSLLAIFHLAYLGSSFDLSEEQSSTKYVLQTWFDIGFYSHIIGFMTVIFYFLIK